MLYFSLNEIYMQRMTICGVEDSYMQACVVFELEIMLYDVVDV